MKFSRGSVLGFSMTIAALAPCAGSGFAQAPGASGPPPPAAAKAKIQKPAALRLFELQRKEAEQIQGARGIAQGLMKTLPAGDAQSKTRDALMELEQQLSQAHESLLAANAIVISEHPEILQENAAAETEANKKKLGMNRELIAADKLATAGKTKEALEALAAMEAKYGTDVDEINVRKTVWKTQLGGSKQVNDSLEMAKAISAARVLEETGTQDNIKLAVNKWKRVLEINPASSEAAQKIKELEAKLKP